MQTWNFFWIDAFFTILNILWWIFEKSPPIILNFIWIEEFSIHLRMYLKIAWSRASIFKLRYQGCETLLGFFVALCQKWGLTLHAEGPPIVSIKYQNEKCSWWGMISLLALHTKTSGKGSVGIKYQLCCFIFTTYRQKFWQSS